MTRLTVLLVISLACAPALAQSDPDRAPELTEAAEASPEDAETSGDAAGSEPVEQPNAGAETRDSEAAVANSADTGASTASAATSTSTGASPSHVVVRHDDDEEGVEWGSNARPDEEPEPDPGDPYDILWIELFGGGSYVDLRAVDTTNFYPEFVRFSGWGPAGGAAIGFRVEFVSIGVRGAVAHYDVSDAGSPDAVFDVGTLAAEVKLALPIPVVQPFIRVGFGFGWHGDSNAEEAWASRMPPSDIQTTVFGWVFQGAVGVDVYLAHWFAIGAAFSLDILNMSRQSWDEQPTDPRDVMFRDGGDAVGAQGRAQLAVSFHF